MSIPHTKASSPLATIVRPPASPLVPADFGNARNTAVRHAAAINQMLRGKLSATVEVTIVNNGASSALNDSRIGPFSAIRLVPLTPHAAALLPTIWVEPSQGYAILHHGNTTYTDCTYIALIIGA